MGREGARRLVLPASAEGDRDGGTRGSHITARFHGDDRFVDECSAPGTSIRSHQSPHHTR
ncbi:hypothetical protein JCM4814A_85630 [Streptomyces phaeofaciens JCM 4814]|uniref:Uncharacterized protein n=1 Tax=Streptomyces phaeofaciens TaxID=68254 RepID=A0A918H7T5_9ACTN|nr:hypothetical protein GCM10010226_21210 [Streptomyces phaeofaciens]